ncbi:MAG: DUF5403 family protein [Actinobacteria bacterium]|nr:DUF5403 family protein [Actinomycetota bacterium]
MARVTLYKRKFVEGEASHLVGESQAMDAVARRIKGRVLAEAARHRQTGAYMASIKIRTVRPPAYVTPGHYVKDRLIYTDDPAALSIEFGRKPSGHKTQRPVGGQHIFTRALMRARF